MAKLHELLAVESGLLTTAKKINDETVRTFNKRDEHFVASVKATEHFDEEDAKKLNTVETKEMITTVIERLGYGVGPNVRALDVFFQKEATNQKAVADLVVGDVVLAKDVPATVLLGLETKVAELRTVYEAIPTLAPGPTWMLDADRPKGVFVSSHPDVTFRTRKTVRPIIMAPATQHHPAQVQAVSEDVPVARIITQHWSGMLTSAQKAALLERVDRLLRGLKRARQRANNTEADTRKIGADLFNYIHEGIVT